MHIHKRFAQRGQGGQRGGRTVDELAIGARAGKRPFKHELMILARLQAIFLQEPFQREAQPLHVEHRFHGTALLAAANERAIGAFAEDEIERAQDDGLARAGLAGDNVATGLEFQREVGHEGEVLDAQRRQHGANGDTTLRITADWANRKIHSHGRRRG